MKKRTLFKFTLSVWAIFTMKLAAFQVVDVEIPIQMNRNDEQKKIFVVDIGERNRIAAVGNLLAVLRKDEYGSLQPVGILEIIATANQFCKTHVKSIIENPSIQQFGIKGIAVKDSIFPLVMLPSQSLFGNINSAVLTKAGMELLADKVVSFLHQGNFKNMLLFAYSNRKLADIKETALAEAQAVSIKKHFMAKHGFAEGMLKITVAGNNNPFNKLFADSRHDFLFAFDPNFKEESKPHVETAVQQDKDQQKDDQKLAKTDTSKVFITKPIEISSPGEIIFRESEQPAEITVQQDTVQQKDKPEPAKVDTNKVIITKPVENSSPDEIIFRESEPVKEIETESKDDLIQPELMQENKAVPEIKQEAGIMLDPEPEQKKESEISNEQNP